MNRNRARPFYTGSGRHPDEAAANQGYWQSLAETSACPLTWAWAGPGLSAHVLLRSGSRREHWRYEPQKLSPPRGC